MATETDIGVLERPAAKPLAADPASPVAAKTPCAKPFTGYRLADFNFPRFIALTLITLSGLTVLFGAATFVGWLWSAWNPA